MVYVKIFFNDKCFKRIALQLGENQHEKIIRRCIYHASKYRGYTLLETDFFPVEELHPTLLNEHFHKVSLGKGYHYEYYA